MAIRLESIGFFANQVKAAAVRPGNPRDKFIAAELRKTILQDISRSERALRTDFARRHAVIGKPGGMAPGEFKAYAIFAQHQLKTLGELRRLTNEPGQTSALLYDIRAKQRNVGKPGGLSPEQLPAYIMDMTYRAKHRIPGGPGAPYPKRFEHLVSSVNTMETLATARQGLVRDQMAKSANVGRAGGMSPEQFQAYTLDMGGRMKKLDTLEDLIKRYEMPKELVTDIKAKASNLGKPGGLSPEEFDAYVLDMGFRAKYKIPGPPGSMYPADKAHLIPSINAMETVSAASQDILRDMKLKAANVGRAGGMSPEEYQAYHLDMSTRLQIVDRAANLLRQVELPAAVARDLQSKLKTVGRAGGMSPEEFSAYLADVRTKAIGPGPLAGGFNRVR